MGRIIDRRRVMGGNHFIEFADPAMKALCVGLWGGADGGTAALNTRVNNVKVIGVDGELTYEQAASIKSIVNSQFLNNTTIKSFDELQYFTELTSIGSSAFRKCTNFTSITIPDSVTSIGVQAFSTNLKLTSITIQATTPPILAHENAFSMTNNCPIYVPSGSVEAYKNANVWSNLSSRILAIPTN